MKGLWSILFWVVALGCGQAQPPSKFYCTHGTSGDDVAYACAQTQDGHFVFVGSTTGGDKGQTDVYLLKTDQLGQLIWQKFIGGSGNEIGKSIIAVGDSGFIINGYTNSYGNGGYDMFVVRTDTAGEVLWQNSFGTSDWDFGADVFKTSDDNFIAVGSSYGNMASKQDGYAVKFNWQGQSIWEKFYGGSENDEFTQIYSSDGNDFYISGLTNETGNHDGDMYCVKINTNGDTLHTLTYSTPGFEKANDVLITSNNEIILVGAITSTLGGETDAGLLKFDASKNLIWMTSYSMSNEDEECYRIIHSASPITANQIAVYTTHEIQGFKKDTKTIYIDANGLYAGGWYSGSFGFAQDDEIFDILVTDDNGYISCGYSNSFTTGNTDILIIKRDSVLNPGLSIVDFKENEKVLFNSKIFPNPILKGSHWLQFEIEPGLTTNLTVSVIDLFGKKTSLLCNTESLTIDISGLEAGMYILTLETLKGNKNFKLLIR